MRKSSKLHSEWITEWQTGKQYENHYFSAFLLCLWMCHLFKNVYLQSQHLRGRNKRNTVNKWPT